MPTLDELLAAAEDIDSENEQETAEPQKGKEDKATNSAFKQVRDHARKLERDLKKIQAERDGCAARAGGAGVGARDGGALGAVPAAI